MLDKAKAPILVLVFLVLISLFLAGGGFYLLQQEKTKTASLEKELESVKAAQKATETKLVETKKILAVLELKIQDAEAQIETITRSLAQEKASRQEAVSKIELMKTELELQKQSRTELETKLNEAQESVKTLQSQLKTIESKRTDLETKVKDLEAQLQDAENRIELGKVVVTPESSPAEMQETVVPTETTTMSSARISTTPASRAAAPVSSSEGSILVINKEYNFAVINLGLRDGVRVGDVFSVYRVNKYLGDLRVDKVHDAMAAAGFVSQDLRDKVAEGDKVVLKAR